MNESYMALFFQKQVNTHLFNVTEEYTNSECVICQIYFTFSKNNIQV